jgi:ribosome-binding protein aMBF1 (putative translation factor)
MAKKYSELRKKMTPEALQKSAKLTKKLLAEMPLQELRKARALSQEQLAKELHIKQASVSKLERRTDMYIQTLRGYIEAMGGVLEIKARFPEGIVKINQFGEEKSNID